MDWIRRGGRNYERMIPHGTPSRDLPGLQLRYQQPTGTYVFPQSEGLTLRPTTSAMHTFGSINPTQPRDACKPTRLSSSDGKAVSLMKQAADEQFGSAHMRRHTTSGHAAKLNSIRVPSASKRLQPILPSIKKTQVTGKVICEKMESPITSTEASTEIEICNENDEENEETLDSEDDDITDTDSSIEEIKPSGLSFHDESHNGSFVFLEEINFPSASTKMSCIPATMIQTQMVQEHEHRKSGMHPSGLSSRINNIVRAFDIKGPLDKKLLENALHKVVNVHPVLSSKFVHQMDKVYLQTSQDNVMVDLETPFSRERTAELITLARRKIFDIPIKTVEGISALGDVCDIQRNSDESEGSNNSLTKNNYLDAPLFSPHPKHLSCVKIKDDAKPTLLMRAKLVSINVQNHVLVLSFPRAICDFWSSCLFIQQLVDVYGKLEKSPSYRPSLAALKVASKRQETINVHDSLRARVGLSKLSNKPTFKGDAACRLLQKQLQEPKSSESFSPICPPLVHFQQVALRETEVLLMRPKEKLYTFWESVMTVTIRRSRGASRIKVIPPIRIPSGLGEITRTVGAVRPTTARLRPLTARNRPTTAKRGNMTSDVVSQESLSGPQKGVHFMKIEESVGFTFLESAPEQCLAKIDQKELLGLMCLGAYVLILGKCCKGWGIKERERGRVKYDYEPTRARDPLKKYDGASSSPETVHDQGISRRKSNLDAGSFLIGIETSLRQIAPQLTQGLFGPLSNVVGIRVDLSSNETFADLLLSLWRSVHSARCHSHYPFNYIAEELGLVHGLPVQFSYFYPHDVQQLSNPDAFYFMETSVGFKGKALARLGSCCYMNPLSTKADDNCQLELMMWEGVRSNGIDGIFQYQSKILKPEFVEALANEMISTVHIVAKNPTISLKSLAVGIKPPFLHSSLIRRLKV